MKLMKFMKFNYIKFKKSFVILFFFIYDMMIFHYMINNILIEIIYS